MNALLPLLAPLLVASLQERTDVREPAADAVRWRAGNSAVLREDAALASVLERALSGEKIPGAVAAVADRSGGVRAAAWGVRKAGTDVAMTVEDPVHIGSDTKAMTAALVARLVEKERLAWDATLGETVPRLVERIDEGWRDVTVLQLLRHTGGVAPNASGLPDDSRQGLRERRLQVAGDALSEPPRTAPGEAFEYSNLGYLVVGVMCEAAADEPWESLMRREVFEPLGMTRAGFGPPGTPGEVDAPWGHRIRWNGASPVQSDNDAALGPAGTVHLPIASWARFALEFTDAAAREPGFLSEASRAQLVEVGLPTSGYACGWAVVRRPWAGGTALTHSGSNTMWFATVWVAPKKDRAYLVALNAAGDGVPEAADRVIAALIAHDAGASSGR